MTVVTPSLCSRKCSIKIPAASITASGTFAVPLGGNGNTGQGHVNRLPDEVFTLCQSDGQDFCVTSDSAGTTQLAVELVAGSYSAGSKTADHCQLRSGGRLSPGGILLGGRM